MIAPGSGYDGAAALRACPTPCTPDCPDRHGGCQITCEKYKEWKPRYDETLLAIKAQNKGGRAVAAMIGEKRHNKRYLAVKAYNRRGDKGGAK